MMKRITAVAATALGAFVLVGGPVTPSQAACPAGAPEATAYYCTPSAPAVTTGNAAPVISNAAVLNGTVNANGQATQFAFQFGTTPALGQTTAAQAAPADFTARPVASLAAGLTAGTTYFYRIIAINSSGAVPGAVLSFRTTGTAPGPGGPRPNPPAARKPLPRVSLSVRPTRDRSLPYRFTTSGRITLPNGVSRSDGCEGRIIIRFLRANRVVARNATRVSSTCRYSKRTSILTRARLRRGGGSLSVSIRFQGNDALRAKSAPRRTVRYGNRR